MIVLNIKFIKFHGISWNSMELQKSSMESMVFHGTFLGKIKSSMEFHGILWNSGVWKTFHGIFMELWIWTKFHGILHVSVIGAVPWNSMDLVLRQFRWHEQFYGIPLNSMELEVRQFRWHEQSHGIPTKENWGCGWVINWIVKDWAIKHRVCVWPNW